MALTVLQCGSDIQVSCVDKQECQFFFKSATEVALGLCSTGGPGFLKGGGQQQETLTKVMEEPLKFFSFYVQNFQIWGYLIKKFGTFGFLTKFGEILILIEENLRNMILKGENLDKFRFLGANVEIIGLTID